MSNEDLSKEFYSLSKIKNLLKKEYNNLNKLLYELELKKMVIINNVDKINSLDQFNDKSKVQILKVCPNNGIEKTIAIIKTEDLHIDRKFDKFSNNLNKSLDYVAIDIQQRYVMKNEKYFEIHFNPIYQEFFKDPNEKINTLKKRIDVVDLNVKHNDLSYKLYSLNASKKQNLINVKDSVNTLIESISSLDIVEKSIIINKHIKSIDARIDEIKKTLYHDFTFKGNEYCSITIVEKKDDFDVCFDTSSSSMIAKTLNGHAIITKALKDGVPILDEMYENNIEYKIIEMGTKESVINKINNVLSSIENNHLEKSNYLDNLIKEELESKNSDSFESMFN